MAWSSTVSPHLRPLPHPYKEGSPNSMFLLSSLSSFAKSLAWPLLGPDFLCFFLLSSYSETLGPWLALKAQCKAHLLCEAFLDHSSCSEKSWILQGDTFSLSSMPCTCFAPCLQQVQPITQPSSVRMAVSHPPGSARAGPPPGRACCTHSPQTLAGGSLGWTTVSSCYKWGTLG